MVGSAQPHHHSLVRGGYSYHVASRMGLEPATTTRRLTKVLLLILVTWVPLVLLSLWNGHAWGHLVEEPLLLSTVIYSRFLFVVPLLELAQLIVETSLDTQMRHFLDSGLVPAREQAKFLEARQAVIRSRGSVGAEVAIAIAALTLSVTSRVFVRAGLQNSTWERLGDAITPAGWWYIVVSLPILFFSSCAGCGFSCSGRGFLSGSLDWIWSSRRRTPTVRGDSGFWAGAWRASRSS